MQLQLGLVAAFALIGGALGWRSARKRWHSFYDETPGGMSDDAYRRRERRRHVFRRVLNTALYAVVGAIAGWAVSFSLGLP